MAAAKLGTQKIKYNDEILTVYFHTVDALRDLPNHNGEHVQQISKEKEVLFLEGKINYLAFHSNFIQQVESVINYFETDEFITLCE